MARPSVTPAPPGSQTLELDDVQGIVARAYGHLPFARYLLCRVGEPAAARAWLGQVAGQVFTADRRRDDVASLNIALTWAGLQRLGLADDALATFARPLQEGMVSGHRSRILGDLDGSAPSSWSWGGSSEAQAEIHVLLMLFAPTIDVLEAELAALRAGFGVGGALHEIIEPIEGHLMDGYEHFGFADGLSQPRIKGWPRRTQSVNPPAPPPDRFDEVEAGEILLGYTDNYGKVAAGPTVADKGPARSLPAAPWAKGRRDLGRNGSLLVFRQLAQDVAAFRAALEAGSEAAAARGWSLTSGQLGAKMVGRWTSGAPIVLHPETDPGHVRESDFDYTDTNQRGLATCPIGAHIRRGNPRDAPLHGPGEGLATTLNHRILRRGRPYGLPIVDPPTQPGEEASAPRGLLFLSLQVDIERQFEFVQHTWIENPYFSGLCGEVDPFVGNESHEGFFTLPGEPVRQRVSNLPTFVTTRGGAYFFLPGVKALTYLSQMPG